MYIIYILHMIYLFREVFFIISQVLKKYGRIMLFPGIICIILLYIFLQQEPSDEEAYTITTIPQEQSEEVKSDAPTEQAEPKEEPIIEKIMVDVKGAVKSPGVYEVTTADRVIDAIERAGGYTAEAQSMAVNHAQKLQDEMVIYIPVTGEEIGQNLINGQVTSSPATSTESLDDKVDLNSADEAALTTLPGIGPSKAQAIIAYREESGPYQTIDDLKNVSGIGDKTFDKLKEMIMVK
ncbi:helix-hairpin-helix domain-containing protein [Ureibacillus aquaedulcis]|uniref:Helix-hairpin-helix domain-containing protein n=1 Tax=Ureibacillus aquaedulcis TaxID=3058421 RepID=A0ABT8GV86_9BACL|nr:helix-hairpin-helix domain-containing protein [Ureibacillus sp. BA0131]MDN4495310.1 helix-hairpin-helix domain-containing protein [Ureibacillus sp. BA0131]